MIYPRFPDLEKSSEFNLDMVDPRMSPIIPRSFEILVYRLQVIAYIPISRAKYQYLLFTTHLALKSPF